MRIFLAIPFSRNFSDISRALIQVVEDTGHEVIRADEFFSLKSITKEIHQEINKADIVIADISNGNSNVIFEVGLAKGLEIPLILISQQGEIMADLESLLVIRYDRNRLHQTLITTMQHYLSKSNLLEFHEKKTTDFQEEKEHRKTVFVSYSQVDKEYLERLNIHLKPFEKRGLIDLWSDTKIKAGEKWKERIERALDNSAIAILLISADFLASDFIIDNELPPLLKAAENKGKIILPVIIRPCRFVRDKNLSKFQAINDPKYPMSKLNENDKEEVYVRIANYIDDLVN